MPRLPQLGSDADQWGRLLNEFLRVAHHEDGTLRGVIEVINVKDYGAIGDGNADDTAAIQQALAAASFLKAVYFPAGTYSVTAGIDITGRRMIGEPPVAGQGGSLIRVSGTATTFDGAVLYSGEPPPPDGPKPARPPVNLSSIQVDANFKADYGIHLFGATGNSTNLWNVYVRQARLDNFFFDACQVSNFSMLESRNAGRHGIHLCDCNGAKLLNFRSLQSGSPVPGGSPNPNGYGLFIEAERHSGGVFIAGGDIESGYGPAIYVHNISATTTIEKIWIENGAPNCHTDPVVIDNARSVVLQQCRITGGADKMTQIRAIRLKNAAISNIICANFIAMHGETLPGTGLSYGDQIEIEAGCQNNHIEGNQALRSIPVGILVNTTDRSHTLGQRQVMSYAAAAPTTGTWQRGDIVFNIEPVASGFVGWVCMQGGSPGVWKAFGAISA